MKISSELASSQQRRNLLDQLTAHKVALVALIQEYCHGQAGTTQKQVQVNMEYLFSLMFPSPEQEREFLYTLLQLVQEADMDLLSLCERLKEKASPGLYKAFVDKLEELEGNLDTVVELFLDLPALFALEPQVITKTSVIGLFLRRLSLAYDKLSFSQVTQLYHAFRAYYKPLRAQKQTDDEAKVEPSGGDDTSAMDEPMTLQDLVGEEKPGESASRDEASCVSPVPPIPASGIHSKRQAEYFIAQQAQLLHHNELAALPPQQLQQRIMDLLKNDLSLAEAHFLAYLNSLRIGEYLGALESLHHYFDRHCLQADMLTSSPSKVHKDEDVTCKGLRYAALNLASLHFRFGHRAEALAATREAIRMAQETNDSVCLQHALGWLHRLGEQGCVTTAHLMERLCNKSIELNLPYLTSLGVQAFAKHNAVASSKPASVLEFLSKSDVQNCRHSLLDLMSISFAQKAALWVLYGNREMSSLSSQCMLHLNTAEAGVYHSGESGCIAMCSIATQLADQGGYNTATAVLNHCKAQFPSPSQHARIWQLCDQQLLFDMAVHLRNFDTAERAATAIAAISETEAHYRQAVLHKEKGDLRQAFDLVERLLQRVAEDKTGQITAAFTVRLLILMGEVHCCTGNSSRAGQPFLEALNLCNQHHLCYLATMAKLHLAHVQFLLGMPRQALAIIKETLVTVLCHGPLYDQARVLMLYAKCMVAAAKGEDSAERETVIQDALRMMSEARSHFEQIEAHFRVKDVLYYQARLYNELGYTSERNKCAHGFRELDQLMPTQSKASVSVL